MSMMMRHRGCVPIMKKLDNSSLVSSVEIRNVNSRNATNQVVSFVTTMGFRQPTNCALTNVDSSVFYTRRIGFCYHSRFISGEQRLQCQEEEKALAPTAGRQRQDRIIQQTSPKPTHHFKTLSRTSYPRISQQQLIRFLKKPSRRSSPEHSR